MGLTRVLPDLRAKGLEHSPTFRSGSGPVPSTSRTCGTWAKRMKLHPLGPDIPAKLALRQVTWGVLFKHGLGIGSFDVGSYGLVPVPPPHLSLGSARKKDWPARYAYVGGRVLVSAWELAARTKPPPLWVEASNLCRGPPSPLSSPLVGP